MQTLDVGSLPRPAAAAIERSLLIQAEQIRQQYRIMPAAFIGSALVATLVVAMLCDRFRVSVLMPWLLAVYILSLARLGLWRWFKVANPVPARIERWGRLAVLAGGLSGLLWGVGGIVLHDRTSLAHQLFVLVATTGLGFTSTYMTAPLMPAFLAYVCPSFLLSAIPFLLDGERAHVAIGVVTVLMLPVVIQFAVRVSRSFLESVSVRLQNFDLMEELRRQKEAAEEANVAKSRFLAVASHDLRQPLHALGLFVQALQESSIAAQERHIVGNIRRSVDAMEELFDALLDISRLDAGVVRPRFETFALAAVFDRLNFEYGPVAKQKGLSLRVMKTSAYICTDPSLFERIVRNLLSNAVRYTDRGGLVLGCRRQDGGVRVEIWDTGRGIPAEKHREIFREFAQLDPAGSDPRRGLGLGLAIVERLARLLDHEIRLRSVPGKGSVFSVSVPRGREQDVACSSPVESTTPFDLTGVLILVIDSDTAVLQAMETLLAKWNCEVIAAASGEEMKQKLAVAPRVPSLIIADYRPRGPGRVGTTPTVAVIEMLRNEFNSEIPAVLLTGDTATTERSARLAEVAGLPVLHKPLNPARLRTLIANLLRIDDTQERSRRAS
ncbi:MAG: hybrid sensor histidine kinase/response regulator [Sinobacteraceae bacterium]|nr:hybrid sensor histidine kinase/response regulator [Nevskiaceae bacterium]